ncbi:MAG: cupin domain-containing protein [Bacteroidales bacterium]|nr:cupin domain-containing protein [Bacteroidales bacterium]
MLKITTPETAPRVPFQVDGRIMLSRPKLEIIHLTLKPAEVVPKHINDFDVAIYVLEGTGKIETGFDSGDVKPGMLIEIEAGEERGMANTGRADFRVLVIKLPGG